MSANIYWQPVSPVEDQNLDVSCPSSFWECLEKATESYQAESLIFSRKDLELLRVTKRVGNANNDDMDELINTVERVGSIRIYRRF